MFQWIKDIFENSVFNIEVISTGPQLITSTKQATLKKWFNCTRLICFRHKAPDLQNPYETRDHHCTHSQAKLLLDLSCVSLQLFSFAFMVCYHLNAILFLKIFNKNGVNSDTCITLMHVNFIHVTAKPDVKPNTKVEKIWMTYIIKNKLKPHSVNWIWCLQGLC